MSDGTTRRPHDRDGEPEERPDDQDRLEQRSRSGGDAEAAGTPAEREAIARDEDDPWSEEGSEGEATGD
jgi:hypothetical protein